MSEPTAPLSPDTPMVLPLRVVQEAQMLVAGVNCGFVNVQNGGRLRAAEIYLALAQATPLEQEASDGEG